LSFRIQTEIHLTVTGDFRELTEAQNVQFAVKNNAIRISHEKILQHQYLASVWKCCMTWVSKVRPWFRSFGVS